MSTFRTHFSFRIDTWTPDGESVVEHVAGVEDYQVALATFLAACQRWPGIPITLRQGARVNGYRASPARSFLRATTRNPSCLTSCSHSLPEGILSVLVGRHGAIHPARRVRCNITPKLKAIAPHLNLFICASQVGGA
jgi:hypothetical protein